MSRNLGQTSLKRRRKSGNAMQAFDRLPAELRGWLSTAVLPWHPQSVRRIYAKAFARTRDRAEALEELDRIQDRRIAQDARKIWGAEHPAASVSSRAPR